jgi:hypothetical protein
LGVDALFPENLIDIGSVAMKFIGKPCDGSLLLAQFLLYQASDMDHLLARIIVMTHNKKTWEFILPRLSLSPGLRIAPIQG